jgi:hypothetical protein
MIFLVGIGIAVVAFALWIACLRATDWLRERQTTRFVFEDRDTYLSLKVDRPLGSDDRALMTMQTLREALRLRLMGVGYKRVLMDLTKVRIANQRAFWYLIGALAPALGNHEVRWAVVCRRRTQAEKHFRESGILSAFHSSREAEKYLASDRPRVGVLLDAEQLHSLLAPRQSRAA